MYSRVNQAPAVEKPVSPLFNLLDDSDIENQPPIEWMLEGILPRRGMSEIFGEYRHGKSFVALHFAYRVATEFDGYVVYIAAEGKFGFGQRVRAWKKHYGVEGTTKLKVLAEPVHFMECGYIDALIHTLDQLPEAPVMVVVDTLARCMTGGDENSTKDMGLFVEGLDRVRRAFDCHVMVVHHKPKNGDTSRGSVALPGAMDTVIEVKKDGSTILVRCDKQKEADEFKTYSYTLTPVEGTESCVVVRNGDVRESVALNVTEKRMLEALSKQDRMKNGDWEKESGLSHPTFQRYITSLVREGYVEKEAIRNGSYALTDKGRAAIGKPAQVAFTDVPREEKWPSRCRHHEMHRDRWKHGLTGLCCPICEPAAV